MIIPKTLKVGGHKFTITYPHLFLERHAVWGHTDFVTDSVFISKFVDGMECIQVHVEGTFWHEVFHMIDRIYCCDCIGEKTNKEDMIEGLAQGLLQILSDNFKPLELKENNK